jgi:SNF5 / SMARCB1 / INI1
VPTISNTIKSQIADHKRFYQTLDYPVIEDSRVIIKLDIFAGRVHLRDRFEWDLASDASPEDFAKIMAQDLGLGGEFCALIAHRYVGSNKVSASRSRR